MCLAVFYERRVVSVEDQVVHVPGASWGGGKAIARAFAERAGSEVVITGRDLHSLERVVFDRMETLVNVAGVNQRKPAEAITEEDYDWVLEVDLKGGFRLSQKAGHLMIARGCQINVVSLNTYCPLENVLLYTMSKSALGQMTRALALECGNGDGEARLGAWFYSHGSYPKTLGRSGNAGMRMAEHAFGTAWRSARFGWGGSVLVSPASSFVTGANPLCGRRIQTWAGLGRFRSKLFVGRAQTGSGFDSWQAGKIQGTCGER